MNTRLTKKETIQYLRNAGIMEHNIAGIKSQIISINDQIKELGVRNPYLSKLPESSGVNILNIIKYTLSTLFISLLIVIIVAVLAFVGEVISWGVEWDYLKDISYSILSFTSQVPRALFSWEPFSEFVDFKAALFDIAFSTLGITGFVFLLLVVFNLGRFGIFRYLLYRDRQKEEEFHRGEAERIQGEESLKKQLLHKKELLMSRLDEARSVLDTIYHMDILFPRYQYLAAVCSIYQYFQDDAVTSLSAAIDKFDLNEHLDDNQAAVVQKMTDDLYAQELPEQAPQSVQSIQDASALVFHYLQSAAAAEPEEAIAPEDTVDANIGGEYAAGEIDVSDIADTLDSVVDQIAVEEDRGDVAVDDASPKADQGGDIEVQV